MKKILILAMAWLLTACHSLTYTTQVDEQSYVQFSGNFANTVVAIDDTVFQIDDNTETFELQGEVVAKFPVATGKHMITITKNNKVLVKKYIFSSEGQTIEVNVP